jgi:tetratricopeptide (TPR) repeat protein
VSNGTYPRRAGRFPPRASRCVPGIDRWIHGCVKLRARKSTFANESLFRIVYRQLCYLLIVVAVALGASPGLARAADAPQAAVANETLEISEEARKAYAKSMREVRDLMTQRKYDDAIARLDGLAASRPREPQARFLKAVALTDQKKLDAAMDVYRGLVADFPEMPEPHNNLAVLYAQKGELAQARDELLLAVRVAPDYAVGHENLGDVYAQLAAEQYEQVAGLDKKNKTAPVKLNLVHDAVAASP